MRTLDIHNNIPVSVAKLMLGLRVGFISSHLVVDKLFPVNPRAITGPPKMSILHEAKGMPALIIKPRPILVSYTDDLGLYITSNKQGKMFVQNLNRIVRNPNVTPRQYPYCTADSIPIDLMFQENFPSYLQVWNCLSHRNDCDREEWFELPIGATTATRTKLGTSVIRRLMFHHEHGLGEQPTDRNRRLLWSQRLQLHDGSWS